MSCSLEQHPSRIHFAGRHGPIRRQPKRTCLWGRLDRYRRQCVTTAFSPQSKTELQSAIATCLELSPQGDCFDGPHGPIEEWDVCSVTDMSVTFLNAASFNDNIWNWDARIKRGFMGALAFNSDISKWDVASVTDMTNIFASTKFNGDVSEWDVSKAPLPLESR